MIRRPETARVFRPHSPGLPRVMPMALLLTLLLVAPAARAEVRGISLAVNGVVCPVCAHSINMGLRRLDGIKSVKVFMEAHVKLDITLRPGTWVEPGRIFQQISLVGYHARQQELAFRLRGTVTQRGDQLLLTMTDVGPKPVSFLLDAADLRGKSADVRLSLENLRKTGEMKSGTQTVEVEGLWRPATVPGQPVSLLLTRAPVLL